MGFAEKEHMKEVKNNSKKNNINILDLVLTKLTNAHFSQNFPQALCIPCTLSEMYFLTLVCSRDLNHMIISTPIR